MTRLNCIHPPTTYAQFMVQTKQSSHKIAKTHKTLNHLELVVVRTLYNP